MIEKTTQEHHQVILAVPSDNVGMQVGGFDAPAKVVAFLDKIPKAQEGRWLPLKVCGEGLVGSWIGLDIEVTEYE